MKKVIVGLSGGVDSSVAALLLKKQGYYVEALFMRNWDSELNNDIKGNKLTNICPQESDYQDAVNVAKQLDIKLHRYDFINEYWDKVFKHFILEYKNGRTPNPDILCNKYIKFDMFLNYALNQLKADYIATGHYCGVRLNKQSKEFELIKAFDQNKDQTYFLAELNQFQLSKSIFPLANYNKQQIREIAKNNNLITYNKKDSTGICFIGERKFGQFLQNYIPNKIGSIIDITSNKKIGEHIGVMYYTIGQRKGLNLSGQKEPYYVAKKDVKNNILYVCPLSNIKYMYTNECDVVNFNWIVNYKNYFNSHEFECFAKFRYCQDDVKVKVNVLVNNNLKIKLLKQCWAITPGQEAVLYYNNVCLGGGIIK